MEGLLIMQGPMMPPATTVIGATITDIAPTILYAVDLPIPQSMDGRVLNEIVAAVGREVRYAPGYEPALASPGEAYGKEEALAIEERLRGLGYIQ